MAGKDQGVPPALLRGSLVTIRRKCGTASCHCTSGEPHEGRALSVSVAGRTRMVGVPGAAVAEVERALARYRARAARLDARAAVEARAAVAVRAERARLAAGAIAGLEGLRARLAARRSRPVR